MIEVREGMYLSVLPMYNKNALNNFVVNEVREGMYLSILFQYITRCLTLTS